MKLKEIRAIESEIKANPMSTDEQKREVLARLNALMSETNKNTRGAFRALQRACGDAESKTGSIMRYLSNRGGFVIVPQNYNWWDKESGWC